MTTQGWLQMLFYSVCLLLVAKPVGAYLVRVYDGSLRWLAPSSDRSTGSAASIRPKTSTGPGTPAPCCSSALVTMLLTYLVLRLQEVLPLNPQHLAAVTDHQAFETAASFTTNTNWQSYGGRDDHVVLLADDPARVPQLRLGRRRAWRAPWRWSAASPVTVARERLGNFWVDTGPRHTLHPAAALAGRLAGAGAAGRHPELRELPRRSPRSRAPSRSSRWGRRRARSPSSSSAPTAAASSTRTRRIRSRIPTPWSNFVEMFALLALASGMVWMFGRMVGKHSPRLGGLVRRCSCSLRLASPRRTGRRRGAIRSMPRAGVDVTPRQRQPRRQHGGEGGPLRDCQLGALGRRDHGGVERVGQLACTTPTRRSAGWSRW